MQADCQADAFRAALAYEDPSFQEPLKAAVAAAGGHVSRELRLSELGKAARVEEPILVANLEPVLVSRPELLDALLTYPGKLILNDAEASARLVGSARARWARHLAAKITGGAVYPPAPAAIDEALPGEAPAPREVWVLAASIGGPEALRGFLAEMMPDMPFCLVLAQHIGAEFIELLAQQLDQASRLSVRTAIDGEAFRAGRVYVVPPNRTFRVDDGDRIVLGEVQARTPYSPDINQVITDLVARFRDRANVIVFSGMASDAVEGCRLVLAAGGEVWVQEPETCVVSSMVDGALKLGGIRYRADPVHLAHRLNQRGIEHH